MRFGSVGAVIAAASKKDAVPLLKIGSIPIVRRIVLTLQQAGVFPIVVVTGTEELEVIRQVAPLGVVFIKNKECEKPELFSSVKLGLSANATVWSLHRSTLRCFLRRRSIRCLQAQPIL